MNVNVLVLWLLVWLTLSRLSSGATILNAVAPHIHEDSAPPPLLYFLHIHKTSGTHLAHTLARFNPDDVCRLTQAEPMIDIPSPNPRKHEPRSYEMGFLYKNRHYLAHVCHAEQALVDASMQILAAELARIDQASQEGHHVHCDFLETHWDVSALIVNILPVHSTLVFTMVRAPVARLLSSYFYTVQVTGHMNHPLKPGRLNITHWGDICASTHDAHPSCLYGGPSSQALQLAGVKPCSVYPPAKVAQIRRDVVAEATRNMDEVFAVVIVKECPSKGMKALQALLPRKFSADHANGILEAYFTSPEHEKASVHAQQKRDILANAAVVKTLRELSVSDLHVYKHAVAMQGGVCEDK